MEFVLGFRRMRKISLWKFAEVLEGSARWEPADPDPSRRLNLSNLRRTQMMNRLGTRAEEDQKVRTSRCYHRILMCSPQWMTYHNELKVGLQNCLSHHLNCRHRDEVEVGLQDESNIINKPVAS